MPAAFDDPNHVQRQWVVWVQVAARRIARGRIEADEAGLRYPRFVAQNGDRGVVRFSQSARKHRIGRAHAPYVMDNGEQQSDQPPG